MSVLSASAPSRWSAVRVRMSTSSPIIPLAGPRSAVRGSAGRRVGGSAGRQVRGPQVRWSTSPLFQSRPVLMGIRFRSCLRDCQRAAHPARPVAVAVAAATGLAGHRRGSRRDAAFTAHADHEGHRRPPRAGLVFRHRRQQPAGHSDRRRRCHVPHCFERRLRDRAGERQGAVAFRRSWQGQPARCGVLARRGHAAATTLFGRRGWPARGARRAHRRAAHRIRQRGIHRPEGGPWRRRGLLHARLSRRGIQKRPDHRRQQH